MASSTNINVSRVNNDAASVDCPEKQEPPPRKLDPS